MVKVEDVVVTVLTSVITTLIIIFLLIPLLQIPMFAIKETETIKKYYYPFVIPLEGDYSDWSIYDSFDDLKVYAYYQWAVVNKDETEILLVLMENLGARKYTIATKVVGAFVDEYVFPGVFAAPDSAEGTVISILGSYVVALNRVPGQNTGDGITVWKNGDIVKTLSDAELGFDAEKVYSMSISRSGKYIIVSGKRSATGNAGWVVLVGS